MAAKAVTDIKSSCSTMFPLNYDCVFELFLRLNNINDCINLAEAYNGLQPIADRTYKRKFNKLTIDTQQPIDIKRILYHAGPTAKSLKLILKNFGYKESDLMKIGEVCQELQCLTIKGFDRKKVENNPFYNVTSEHMEELTLDQCSIEGDLHFFDVFENLKCLNLVRCRNVEHVALKRCCDNNQGIKSFSFDSQSFFHPKLLQFLPNLERLNLRYDSRYTKLNILSKLKSLRHLTLKCWVENVNDILADLAKVNILEELVLIDVAVDHNTFGLIKSLEHLQKLTVTTDGCLLPASDKMPSKLKSLKLGGFHFVDNDIKPLVEKLEHLIDINLQDCFLEIGNYWYYDFDTIADFLIEELDEHTHRELNIAVVSHEGNSPETIWTVARQRITNFVEDRDKFKIMYPGLDD